VGSIDIFPWNVNFNTGIAEIDAQHEKLVSLINQLASHAAFKTDLPTLNTIFDQLADYTVYHFQEEEILWNTYFPPEDPAVRDHKEIHESFVTSILDIKAQITVASQPIIVEELLAFLTKWLASHILENDRYMAAMVLSLQSGKSFEQSKEYVRNLLDSNTKVLIHLILSIYENLSVNTLSLMREIKFRREQEDKVKQYAAQLETSFMKMVGLATTLNEMRDPYTVGHERRVSEISVAIAKELGLDTHIIEGIKIGGYLHDLGKMSIPTEILGRPGKLSPIEFELIKLHSSVGYDVLKTVEFPWPVENIALQHHERIDGSGYPNGLVGDEILIEARIVAVADVVEAMSSHRPYRPSLGLDKALAEIERGRGSVYDAEVVDKCLYLFRNKGFQITD
jgi:hemerythrin-like metal-binding protein/putative nucleotidyltransferase with HDIG domain